MADGHTVKKLDEEIVKDESAAPMAADSAMEDIKDGHAEFVVDGSDCGGVEEALGAAAAPVMMVEMDAVDAVDAGEEEDVTAEPMVADSQMAAAEADVADAANEKDAEDADEELPCELVVSMQRRIRYMEVQVEKIQLEMSAMKSRMVDLIHTQNGMLENRVVNENRNVVSAAEFEKMVDEAVRSAAKYGASRKYITRFLVAEKMQENSRYMQKKLGMTLKKKLASAEYVLVDSLYSINK